MRLRPIYVAIALAISGCGDRAPEELDDATLKNRAAALERLAAETTDAQIRQIEADAATSADPSRPDEGDPSEPANAAR
jgi:hypothetical protein